MSGFVLGRAREPAWIALAPGIEAKIRPYDALAWQIARAEAFRRLDARASDAEVVARIAVELGVLLIEAWSGVADAAGEDAPPSPEAVREVLVCVPGALDALQGCVAGYFEVEASKKSSKNGGGGSRRGGPTTAPAASTPAAPALEGSGAQAARSARSRARSTERPSGSGSSRAKGSANSASRPAERSAST